MNPKQLIKEVESLIEYSKVDKTAKFELKGIKQTVEAVDKDKTTLRNVIYFVVDKKDWQKLKKLLGVK